MLAGTNDVDGQSDRAAATAEEEFSTYDVTHIHLYARDGQRLHTTEMKVTIRV